MSTATHTRTAQLLSAQQLREQQETSGREGLASLLKAVRRMLDWLLMPFKMVGRVLFKPRLAIADNAAVVSAAAADRAAGSVNTSPGENSLNASTNGLSAGASNVQDLDGLVKHVADNPDGGLDIEVSGMPEDLDVVLPMLMRHIEQILKTHLPSDAEEAQVETHLVALAETAECARYAHRLVSREVDGALKAVLADPKYVGLSAATIEGMIRSAARSPDAAAQFGDGSAEQRLLSRLGMRDKIEADYVLQMRQMAVALAPMLDGAKAGDEMVGRGKDLLTSALHAAETTAAKLRVRHAAHGASKVLPETLPAVRDAVDLAIASVAQSLQKNVAPEAPAMAAPAAPIAETPVAKGGAELDGLTKAAPEEVAVAQDAAPTPTAATAQGSTAKVADAARAAVVAVQAVRAGGMFGGVATAQRNPAEIDEADLVDDVFMEADGEILVGG
ncbi:hypothetical protein [Massilia orientalis]|uniref:Uncharacterized protein n=1 Tax=Massilia orientalis TaxID=3050128 RepID=A0ACC7MF04_9BURK|nr:hypothetical protein [Massilia sp. YIM B02787]